MPRNIDGSSSVPAGNPVVSGTAINSSVHNNTVADIYSMLADSLSRSGKGGMTAPFQHLDGSAAAPGISFGSETTTGFYRASAGQVGLAILGALKFLWKATGVVLTGDLSFDKAGTTTVATTTANDLAFQTNSTGVLTLKSGGNITLDASGTQVISKASGGIGVTVPNATAITLGITGGPTLSVNSLGISLSAGTLTGLAAPFAASDAATKTYVDSKYGWAKVTGATGAIARSGGGLSISSARSSQGVYTISATNLQNGSLVGTVMNASHSEIHIVSESSGAMVVNIRDHGGSLRDFDFFVQAWVP